MLPQESPRSKITIDVSDDHLSAATELSTSDQSLTVTVIELLAELLDEDPVTMHPPLADIVDPSILESLDQSESASAQTFTFTYRELAVSVTSWGTVSVSESSSHAMN